MAKGIGPKRLVVGSHYGLKDWLLQRITAVIMALYTIVLLVLFLINKPVDYPSWASLFSHGLFKILTFLTLASLFYHAWIGIRDIWMDYIKPTSIRLSLHVLTVLWLIGCLVYSAVILWRI